VKREERKNSYFSPCESAFGHYYCGLPRRNEKYSFVRKKARIM